MFLSGRLSHQSWSLARAVGLFPDPKAPLLFLYPACCRSSSTDAQNTAVRQTVECHDITTGIDTLVASAIDPGAIDARSRRWARRTRGRQTPSKPAIASPTDEPAIGTGKEEGTAVTFKLEGGQISGARRARRANNPKDKIVPARGETQLPRHTSRWKSIERIEWVANRRNRPDKTMIRQAELGTSKLSPQSRKTLHRRESDREFRRDLKRHIYKEKDRRSMLDRWYLEKYDSGAFDWRHAFELLQQFYQKTTTEAETKEGSRAGNSFSAAFLREKSKRKFIRSLDEIVVPDIWSTSSLAQHVYHLAHSDMTPHVQRVQYGNECQHSVVVKKRLLQIVYDDSLKRFFTYPMLHTIIIYLLDLPRATEARNVFAHMEKVRFQPNLDTFNIIMTDMGKRKNLHAFTSMLQMMLRRGISPNEQTWSAFFRCIASQAVRLGILRVMRERGVMEHATAQRTVAACLVAADLREHMSKGLPIREFLKTCNARYGAKWCTSVTANTIYHALVQNGRLTDAFDAMSTIDDANVRPDSITLNIMLAAVKHTQSIEVAVEVLGLFETRYNVKPQDHAFAILWFLAIDLELVNVAKVIWTIACVQGQYSRKMRHDLRNWLIHRPSLEDASKKDIFNDRAKLVILDFAPNDARPHVINRLGRRNRQGLVRSKEDGEKLHSLARDLVDGNLGLELIYKFEGSISELLAKAIEVDKDWAIGTETKARLNWQFMRQHSIRIPLAPNTIGDLQPWEDMVCMEHAEALSAPLLDGESLPYPDGLEHSTLQHLCTRMNLYDETQLSTPSTLRASTTGLWRDKGKQWRTVKTAKGLMPYKSVDLGLPESGPYTFRQPLLSIFKAHRSPAKLQEELPSAKATSRPAIKEPEAREAERKKSERKQSQLGKASKGPQKSPRSPKGTKRGELIRRLVVVDGILGVKKAVEDAHTRDRYKAQSTGNVSSIDTELVDGELFTTIKRRLIREVPISDKELKLVMRGVKRDNKPSDL